MTEQEKRVYAAKLDITMVQNCRMLTDRHQILQHLPKGAKGIEVGVLGGDWSQHLLEITNPTELILADTFCSNDYPHKNRFNKSNHEFYIKSKFELLGEKVKVMKGLSWDILSDGYLVMNDYILYDHFAKEEYGVVQATNEFMVEYNFEMIYFALHPEMFCDVLIRRIQA